MCGIAGLFDTRGKRDFERPDAAHERRPAPSRPGRGRLPLRAGRRARPPAPVHHRPRHRPATAVQRGRLGGGGVQRRDLQLPELVPELEALGHVFHTRSDTGGHQHAWEAWGEDCVQRFRGMFAFALHDRNRDTFFMARDRLAVKPMFYALLPDGTLASAPNSRSLMQHPALDRRIDPLAVEEYFALGYVAEPRTIFLGAESRPWRIAVASAAASRSPRRSSTGTCASRWTTTSASPTPCRAGPSGCDESVRLRMIAEVPLGAFLSGGSIRARWWRPWPACLGRSGQHLLDRLRRSAFNESAFAQMVADRYRTGHFVETVKSDDFDLIDTLGALYDEPYADSSASPPTASASSRASMSRWRCRATAATSFGGYRRYRMHLMEEKMRARRDGRAPTAVRARPRLSKGRLGAARVPRQDHLQAWRVTPSRLLPLASPSCAATCGTSCSAPNSAQARRLRRARGLPPPAPPDRRPAGADPVPRLKTYLVGDINTKVDRAAWRTRSRCASR